MACSIYSSRPRQCQEFNCILLGAYSSGSLSLEDALSTVRDTRANRTAFVAAMAEVMPLENTVSPDKLFERFGKLHKNEFDTARFRKKHSKIMLIYARLKHQLITHFHKPV